MIPFPDSEPMGVGLGHILPLIGLTKVEEQGPVSPLPTAHINITIPTTLTPSPWGRGDPPASRTQKLPSTWKDQAWTKSVVPSVQCLCTGISECSADCKSCPAHRMVK